MMLVAGLLSLWWGVLVAMLAGSALLALAQPRLARGRAGNGERPPVSVLVPLRTEGEVESGGNVALGEQDYPDLEVLFSVERGSQGARVPQLGAGLPSHEAGEVARTFVCAETGVGSGPLAAVHPNETRVLYLDQLPLAGHTPSDPTSSGHLPQLRGEGTRVLLRTTPRPGLNPKIANLIEPAAAAAHDLLLIKDATTLLPPHAIASMVASLVPDVGLVCTVPIARMPLGLAAQVETTLINTYGARLLLALSALGGGAGIGAAMLLRRSDLRKAGGLEAIGHAIADDHALAKLFSAQGLRTVFSPATVDQALGARTVRDVWRRHLRWAICRRLEEPLAFFAEPFTGMLAACLASLGLAAAFGLPATLTLLATLLLWPIVEIMLAALKGWPLHWSTPFAVLLRELAMPALWFSALLARTVVWGSTSISVSARRRP